MERISRFRSLLFLALFAFILVLFAGRLFVLQIVDTKGDTDNAQVYSTVTTVRAARGDILDRNGNVLVGNRASYNLVFNHYVIKSYAERNEALYRLVQKCSELGITYSDHFPVTRQRPFEYTLTVNFVIAGTVDTMEVFLKGFFKTGLAHIGVHGVALILILRPFLVVHTAQVA